MSSHRDGRIEVPVELKLRVLEARERTSFRTSRPHVVIEIGCRSKCHLAPTHRQLCADLKADMVAARARRWKTISAATEFKAKVAPCPSKRRSRRTPGHHRPSAAAATPSRPSPRTEGTASVPDPTALPSASKNLLSGLQIRQHRKRRSRRAPGSTRQRGTGARRGGSCRGVA